MRFVETNLRPQSVDRISHDKNNLNPRKHFTDSADNFGVECRISKGQIAGDPIGPKLKSGKVGGEIPRAKITIEKMQLLIRDFFA
jgi:hypothetical protein